MLTSYLPPLAGGVLIGASAVVLMLFNGRVAGVSGMVRGLFTRDSFALAERLLFLAALVAGAALVEQWTGMSPSARPAFPAWLLAMAGVLVGFGTALARGCTSGHGVCGLARGSLRSLVAVLVFVAVAMLTTFVVRHVWGIA
ncbi:MAG: YeeE/YedE family protein [Pseudomonadota bacterium]|nr:YeeE/YedE family protein [Pseudomonadota bacterium]